MNLPVMMYLSSMDKNTFIRNLVCSFSFTYRYLFTVLHVHPFDMFHLILYCCLKLKLLLSVKKNGQPNMSKLIKKLNEHDSGDVK